MSTANRSPLAWPVRRTYRAPALELRGSRLAWGERTFIMGIINVSPDSFSGDGIANDNRAAVDLALAFEAAGADILDLGGESSRPGAEPLDPRDECARVIPALTAIRAATRLPLSLDTYHASVARAGLEAGADVINDIQGLRFDPEMAGAVAQHGAALVAMHNQRDRAFHDVVEDLRTGFAETLRIAAEAGIDPGRIILDPGFGFGWAPTRNFEIVRRLPELWGLGFPLLVGPSRKSTIGLLLDAPVGDRLEGTAAAVALSVAAGADVVRVHDVRHMARVARVADAIARANWSPS